MSELTPVFFNVNEEGETYGRASLTLDQAMVSLKAFPNDTITVRLLTRACARWLTELDYNLDTALKDGMSEQEYQLALEFKDEEE